jgi:hypothetical protein
VIIDINIFNKLFEKGMNCKQIAKEMNVNQKLFGIRFKELFGIYPSVYMAIKKGKYVGKKT